MEILSSFLPQLSPSSRIQWNLLETPARTSAITHNSHLSYQQETICRQQLKEENSPSHSPVLWCRQVHYGHTAVCRNKGSYQNEKEIDMVAWTNLCAQLICTVRTSSSHIASWEPILPIRPFEVQMMRACSYLLCISNGLQIHILLANASRLFGSELPEEAFLRSRQPCAMIDTCKQCQHQFKEQLY